MAGQSWGMLVGKSELAGSVCQTVSLIRIVEGLSQYVFRVALRKLAVCASQAVTGLESTVTAMLSSFRYSSPATLTLNVSSHSRPNLRENPENVTCRTRSAPHE